MKFPIKTYAGLNKNVYAIFSLMLITATGQFVFAYLSLILTTKFGYGTQTAGYWVSATGFAGFAGALIAGKLSDKFGRRRMLIVILSVAIPGASLCAIFSSSTLLPFLILIIFFFVQGVRPINSAIVTDTTPNKDRGRAFTLIYLGLNIGAALGNIIAGYLFNNYLWAMFLIEASSLTLAAIIVFKFVSETKPTREHIAEHSSHLGEEKAVHSNAFVLLFKKPILLIFTLIFVLYTFIYSQCFFTLPLHLGQIFGEGGVKDFARLNLLNCALVILFTTPLIAFVKNNNPLKNLVISGAWTAIGFGILALNVPSMSFFYLSTALWTTGEILCFPGMNAFISDHSPINRRAGLSSVITGIGFSGFWLGSTLSGVVIKKYGIVNLWLIVLAIAIAAMLAMWALLHVDERRKRRHARAESVALSPIPL